ncbi:MAG: hypothetical protein ACPL1F_02320 [bacterium]
MLKTILTKEEIMDILKENNYKEVIINGYSNIREPEKFKEKVKEIFGLVGKEINLHYNSLFLYEDNFYIETISIVGKDIFYEINFIQ